MSNDFLSSRHDDLDAARAFALVLGVVFHAGLSFLPFYIGWAVQDVSTSPVVGLLTLIFHSFRLEVFFLLSGLFTARAVRRLGAGAVAKTRALRLLVTFFLGWFLLRPLLVSGWVMGAASLRGDYSFSAGLLAGFASLRAWPDGAFVGTHLWFLHSLALITAGYLAADTISRRFPTLRARASHLLDRMGQRLSWPGLAILTTLPLWWMDNWGMDTPDRSLVPHLPTLMVFALFFGVGAWLGHSPGRQARWTQVRPATLVVALITVLGAWMLSRFQLEPAHPRLLLARAGFVLCYAVMMWTLVLLTLGFWRTFYDSQSTNRRRTGRPPRWQTEVRYLAEASYFIYLAHLPLVLWMQVALAELAWPWWIKWSVITIATLSVLLLVYDLCVRATWLGQQLNGRRRPRALLFRPAQTLGAGLTPTDSVPTTTPVDARHDTHRHHL